MPYLEQAIRASLEDGRKATKGGELNYQFSKLANEFINNWGLSYSVINELIGALECCKLELYRKVAADYEDSKEVENGTVWTCKRV
jgi:hypothetical protein